LTTKNTDDEHDETPATVSQLATAMTALGKYAGANADTERLVRQAESLLPRKRP
jgi:hypothetical protein